MTSQLDGLLEKPDITLEAILDEENIINEIKNSGQAKFAKFVTGKPKVYEKMIDYVITYDPLCRDSKIQVKYPFMISEILSVENGALIDFLFDPIQEEESEEKEAVRITLLPRLLSFLKQDWLCVTSAGYFSKSVIPIIKRRPNDFWDQLLKHDIGHLIKHLDTHHIADITEKLLLIELNSITTEDTKLKERQELLRKIISLMYNKSHNQDIVDNISQILNEIVNKAASNPQNKEWQLFVLEINQPDDIFNLAVKTRCSNLFQLLINLINYQQKRVQAKSENMEDEVMNFQYDGEETEPQFYGRFLSVCLKLSSFLNSTSLYGHQFLTTYGEIVEPLSTAKHLTIQLVVSLLSINNPSISENIAQDRTFETIAKLLEKHQFNNQMLILFEKIILIVFNHDAHIIIRSQVTSFVMFLIVKNTNQAQQFGTLKNQIKPGFQGVLTRIANFLEKKATSNPQLSEELERIRWNEYSEGNLRDINEVESKFLCGINPKSKQPNDDEWTDQDVEKILDKFNFARNVDNKDKDNKLEQNSKNEGDEDHPQEQDDDNNERNHDQQEDVEEEDQNKAKEDEENDNTQVKEQIVQELPFDSSSENIEEKVIEVEQPSPEEVIMDQPKDVGQVDEAMIEEKLAEGAEDEEVEVIRDEDIEELTKKFNSSTIHGEEVETSLEKVEEAIFLDQNEHQSNQAQEVPEVQEQLQSESNQNDEQSPVEQIQ